MHDFRLWEEARVPKHKQGKHAHRKDLDWILSHDLLPVKQQCSAASCHPKKKETKRI